LIIDVLDSLVALGWIEKRVTKNGTEWHPVVDMSVGGFPDNTDLLADDFSVTSSNLHQRDYSNATDTPIVDDPKSTEGEVNLKLKDDSAKLDTISEEQNETAPKIEQSDANEDTMQGEEYVDSGFEDINTQSQDTADIDIDQEVDSDDSGPFWKNLRS
jgi:hypothetical protein